MFDLGLNWQVHGSLIGIAFVGTWILELGLQFGRLPESNNCNVVVLELGLDGNATIDVVDQAPSILSPSFVVQSSSI